ncbi:MAG: cadherin-like domain-containing protein, partial [Alcanivoracaceae bacterium]|nr:cadherin-like domain-containing protein [Alcanivoracaceae bacterium]
MKALNNTTLLILVALLFACSKQNSSNTNHPESFKTPENIEIYSLGNIDKEVVQSQVIRPHVNIKQDAATLILAQQLTQSEPPAPKSMNAVKSYKYGDPISDPIEYKQSPVLNKSLQSSIESVDFDSNATNTGFFNIPADPHAAAGINHVVNVVNTSIEIYTKAGALQLSQSLKIFFSGLSPANETFDPKVIYDQYENRFVVVTLESVNTGVTMDDNSAVLVAVSATSDPTGTWYFTRIDVDEVIGGTNSWLDYPGFSVDEEAIYIAGNMFSFASTGSQVFKANRLLIIDKGTTGGFYDNNTAVVSIIDPVPPGDFAQTQQPAHIFGIPANASFGTYLVSYSGLTDGTDEFFQVIQVDTPTGIPTISTNFVNFGNADALLAALADAPQSGTVDLIEVNDRRTLNAVLRGNSLWTATTVTPNVGDPDAGETTALWAELDVDVTAAVTTSSIADVGTIGGEDLATGTYTFFPAIAVNDDGGVAVAYSASASTIFAGSYMTIRSPADAAGTNRGAITIRSGTDFYKRTFGGSRNRWGDYISASLDPDGECFWVYNKYAITRGTILIGEDGRWGTAHGHFCNSQPSAQADDASVNQGQTITELTNMQTSLMFNDTDADSFDMSSLNLTPATNPVNGSVTLFANGTFSYTHDDSSNNSDSFQYMVCDDGSPSKCDIGTVNISVTLDTYTIGGSVSGLIGSVTLQNNNGNDITITDMGLQSFTFPSQDDGSAYAVTVSSQPATQTCTISGGGVADNGSGTLAGANVIDVLVTCTTTTYTVSGTVTGLATDNSVTLQNNGGDDQTITEGGSLAFSFAAQADGSTYALTVFTSPTTPNQTCSITGGTA